MTAFRPFFRGEKRRKSIPRCLLRGLGAEFKTPRSQDSALRTSFQIYLKGASIRESRLIATGVVRQPPSIVITVVPRRPSNQESYRYRYKSLTVRDKMILDSIVLYIQCTGYMLKRTAMERSLRRLLPPRLKEMLAYLLEIYFENSYIRKIRGPRRRHDPITLDMFDEMECWERFRVRKEDIPRVLRALKLDAEYLFVTDNNMKFTGLEVLLIGLHRLVYI